MRLNEFIQHHDTPCPIVLLEGKRNVLENDQDKLVKPGTLLTQMTQHINSEAETPAELTYISQAMSLPLTLYLCYRATPKGNGKGHFNAGLE